MTGAEVDTLRLPLKKKLFAVSDLPSHIVTFRGVVARLATAGQPLLQLDKWVPFGPHRPLPFPRFPPVRIVVYCGERSNCATDV